MSTAKEVTILRKAGKLDLAYQISLDLIAAQNSDARDRAAYAWCLIALVKHHAADSSQQKLSDYLEQLKRFEVPANDDLLAEHRGKALALAQPDRRAALDARGLSKQGKHEEAARIYADLHTNGKLEPDDRKSWGWELYRVIKADLQDKQDDELSPPVVQRVKRQLNIYLKLSADGPDLLHTLMLQQALRLAKGGHLKLLPFLRLWNPEQFSDEDFESQIGKDGKTYPSLVERTIQAAASEAADSDRSDDRSFILPHVQTAMQRFPENIWLKLNYAKLLRGMGRIDEARAQAIEFAREKASEFWAWDLVGDLVQDDPELRLSCYAKALSCSQDDDFVGKVRLKLATLLEKSHPNEARFEIERVMSHRTRAGYPIPREAQALSERLAPISPKSTDITFYSRFSDSAEALLFSHLPWTDASLGDQFTIEGRDGQKPRKRRRIYLRTKQFALELSLPDNHVDIRGLNEGVPLIVQHEMSNTVPGRATIHRIRSRPDGTVMDVAPEQIAVIDRINDQKSLIHVVVTRGVDCTCPISLYPGEPRVGRAVAVRLAQHHGRTGMLTRIIAISATDQPVSADILRAFREATRVNEAGLGFTESDIFIPPHMVAASNIEAGDLVEGIAIASFNEKRGTWGMKAIEVKSVARNHLGSGNGHDDNI